MYWYLQVGGCVDRMHEEQGTGQVLQRAARGAAAFSAPGLLPLETCPTHPQVPLAPARKRQLETYLIRDSVRSASGPMLES